MDSKRSLRALASHLAVLAYLVATPISAAPLATAQFPEPSKAAYRPIELRMNVPTSVLPQPLSEFGTADASGLSNGTINPWLYMRVTAVVTPPSPHAPFQLAGYFMGDGSSGDPCDGFIDVGRFFGVRLSPENWPGTWSAVLHLESGVGSDGRPINVSDDAFPSPVATQLYSLSTSINVVGPNPMAQGFRSKGFLRVDHASPYPYYSFSNAGLPDSERYFLKTGVNSPENFLAYEGFWETDKVAGLGIRHDYAKQFDNVSHLADAPTGAPTWPTRSWGRISPSAPRTLMTFSDDASCGANFGAAGTTITGAIQYLSDQGMNSIYMLPMNLGGDGKDVHPFAVIPENEPTRNTPSSRQLALNYSVKRMQEWNTVFEFANRKGVLVQLVLHERERPNVEWLGFSPELGANPSTAQLRSLTWARRLYLKQMVAHFGHNLGVRWNLCEENAWGDGSPNRQFNLPELRAMAEWIEHWDGYADHPITVHTNPVSSSSANGLDLYNQILMGAGGDWLDATSFQIHAGERGGSAAVTNDYPSSNFSFGPDVYGNTVETMTGYFNTAGRSGVVDVDEQGSPNFGSSGRHQDPTHMPQWLSWGSSPMGRRRLVLYQALFSGGGIEFYFGGSDGAQFPEYGGGDHVANEFRSRGKLWESCDVARGILTGVQEFWTMVPNDGRVTNELAGPMGQAQVFENADPNAGRGKNFASSAESVGLLRLGKAAHGVVEGRLGRWEGPEAVRSSECEFQLVVQALHRAR